MPFPFLNNENPRILQDTSIELSDGWRLHLQYYKYGDEEPYYYGYRFINSENGNLKPQRAQARIPSRKHSECLWEQADIEGWGNLPPNPPTE